jgi:two-component system, NarL family, nitrate/nitrite response regulator NarL
VRRQDVIRATKSGARGFIPKTLSHEAILSALRLVLSGETFIPFQSLEDSDGFPYSGPQAPTLVTTEPGSGYYLGDLTERERQVLALLVKGQSNRNIAESLSLAEVTVKFHLHHLYEKMGVNTRTQAVAKALTKNGEGDIASPVFAG